MRTLGCHMRWLVVVPLLFFCAVAGAAAPTLKFKFTTIDVLGSNDVTLFAVNNSGVMVGNYYSAAWHAKLAVRLIREVLKCRIHIL